MADQEQAISLERRVGGDWLEAVIVDSGKVRVVDCHAEPHVAVAKSIRFQNKHIHIAF